MWAAAEGLCRDLSQGLVCGQRGTDTQEGQGQIPGAQANPLRGRAAAALHVLITYWL